LNNNGVSGGTRNRDILLSVEDMAKTGGGGYRSRKKKKRRREEEKKVKVKIKKIKIKTLLVITAADSLGCTQTSEL
jgi:hypothetical protein